MFLNVQKMSAARELVSAKICEVISLAQSEARLEQTLPPNDALKGWLDRPALKDLHRRCHAELAEMKSRTFANTTISHFTFLKVSKERSALLARNAELAEECARSDWRTLYPIYGFTLELYIERAKSENKVFQDFSTALSDILGFMSPDYVAYEIIFRHLERTDVEFFLERSKEEKKRTE